MLTNILLILLILIAFAIFGELVKVYDKLDSGTAGAKEEQDYEKEK